MAAKKLTKMQLNRINESLRRIKDEKILAIKNEYSYDDTRSDYEIIEEWIRSDVNNVVEIIIELMRKRDLREYRLAELCPALAHKNKLVRKLNNEKDEHVTKATVAYEHEIARIMDGLYLIGAPEDALSVIKNFKSFNPEDL